jgi:hypothetical protein
LERFRTARAQQEELRLAQLRDELVPVKEVDAFLIDRHVAAVQQLRSVGPALAPSLVGMDVATIAGRINDRLEAVCLHLYNDWRRACGLEDSEDGDTEAPLMPERIDDEENA